MTTTRRLLDVVAGWQAPLGTTQTRPQCYQAIFATTFTFEPEFFVNSGVLPALAGLGTERPSQPELVRQRLGVPRVGVLLGRPSHCTRPHWVDQSVWDSPSLGLLHAKCLVAIGYERINCLITSANLTEVSWRRNREGVVVLSCGRDGKDGDVGEVAATLDGLATLAAERGLMPWHDLLRERFVALRAAAGSGRVVWTGRLWPGSVPDRLPRGSSLTAISPFWPPEPAAADLVIDALSGLAPNIRLVTRGTEDGALFDTPVAFAKAAAGLFPPVEVGVAPWTDDETQQTKGLPSLKRPLHTKQITVHTPNGAVSYIGSANVTVRGLSLAGPGNIELGVIVDTAELIDPLCFDEVDTGRCRDELLDDEVIDPESFVSGLAVLHEDRRLEVKLDPGSTAWNAVEVPAGSPSQPMSAQEFVLFLDQDVFRRVIHTPELVFRSGTLTGWLPVLIEDEIKLDPTAPLDVDDGFDTFLLGFGGRVEPDESDESDETRAAGTKAEPPGGGRADPVGVRPVHRARDAIERLQAHEHSLVTRLAEDQDIPPSLFELWLRGTAGVVALGRRLRRAALEDSPPAVTATAAAFILMEIDEMLRRLEDKAAQLEPPRAQIKPPMATTRRIVRSDFDAVASVLDGATRRDIDRLRRRRSRP